MINLTTGPIHLKKKVLKALSASPLPHRSLEFKSLHAKLSKRLKEEVNCKEVVFLQGSGTLANDAMIWQIKMLKQPGIILSNGEFGNRLIEQSQRIDLEFDTYEVEWGAQLELNTLADRIERSGSKWILFTHCETSTGVLNDLEAIAKLSSSLNLSCFVDCMSTLGSQHIDLSSVSMASSSSGKGLCSISGTALIFSNIPFRSNLSIPRYLDLKFYKEKGGIPFTLSSMQLAALEKASKKVFSKRSHALQQKNRELIYETLTPLNIIPFSTDKTHVFTIVQEKDSTLLCQQLEHLQLAVSYQSEYLKSRNWFQLALFSNYKEEKIKKALNLLLEALK